jgi:hypothetical protein
MPADGHPQAAGHFLWFKQLEKAFECRDPVVPGQAQLHLPERIHENSYNWEGEMVSFDTSSERIKGTGLATGGETTRFTRPFKARPFVICTGDLIVDTDNITETQISFSGTSGMYQVIGE